MKAHGTFYVKDIENTISKKGNIYSNVILVDLNIGEDIEQNRLRREGNPFKSFHMGKGIEVGKIYEMELLVNICSDGNDIQIIDYKCKL